MSSRGAGGQRGMSDHDNTPPEMQRLALFVGDWTLAAGFGGEPSGEPLGRATFEWALGDQYVIEKSTVDVPEAPDGLAVMAWHPHENRYVQHYFDSRGVTRLYEMEFDGRVWKLQRGNEDFSALSFNQRYEGVFSDDGHTIDGHWDVQEPGEEWRKDFDLIYRRVD